MKKIINIFIVFISLVFFILIGIYYFGLNDIKKSVKSEFGLVKGTEKEWSKAFKEYEIFQCQFGILKSEYVFVSHRDYSYRNEDKEQWKTTFYQAVRNNIFSSNWQTSYTGGTTIKNTTFPELVKMVKEDCSQFQRSKGDIRDETINWSYSKYVPEVPKTQKEIREEERSLEIFKKKIESGEITRTTLEGFVEIKE